MSDIPPLVRQKRSESKKTAKKQRKNSGKLTENQRKVRRGQDKNHAVLFYTPNPRKIADISHHFIYGMKINKGHCACMGGIP